MQIHFSESAYEDYVYWKKYNPQVAQRIDMLLRDIVEQPFSGIGKPEPLKFDLQGWWSRRIDRTHRLVYQHKGKIIYVRSCRHHY